MKPRRRLRQPPPAREPAKASDRVRHAEEIYRAAIVALQEAEREQSPLMEKIKKGGRLTLSEGAELHWRCSVTMEARGRANLAQRRVAEVLLTCLRG